MLAARVYGLDDILGVGSVIRPDDGRSAGGRGEDGRGEGDCVQVRSLSWVSEISAGNIARRGRRLLTDGRILEDNQKTRVVTPLDFEASTDSLPL